MQTSDSSYSLASPGNWAALYSHAGLALLLTYFGFVYHGVMFTTEGVLERDGFYHARYAQLLPERGLSRELPWMQFADWKDHFCDKDFLYHMLLVPFTRDVAEPLPGAKITTLLLLLATLAAIYVVLRKWNAPFALLWAALTGVGSAHFLSRMFMVRSHCLSVLLMVIATHLILRRRAWPVFAMAFVYSWSYSFPLAMLITACAAEIGRFIVEREWKSSLRVPLVTAAGLLAGLAIHPYTPYSLKSVWMITQIASSGVAGSPLELGTEFRHMSLSSAFTVSIGSTLATLAALSGGVALLIKGIHNRKLAPETAALISISTAWFVLMFVTFERFIEYSAPLGFLACGFVMRDLLGEIPSVRGLNESFRTGLIAGLGLAVMAATGLHAWTLELNHVSIEANSKPAPPSLDAKLSKAEFMRLYDRYKRGRFFDGAAKWMKANMKPGTTVANFYWDDFPELFYAAPEMHYLVGLDPTLMRLQYPEKALALEAMRVKEFPDGRKAVAEKPINFTELKNIFGTDYTILRRSQAAKYPDLYDGNLKQLKAKGADGQIVYEDNEAVIYFLRK